MMGLPIEKDTLPKSSTLSSSASQHAKSRHVAVKYRLQGTKRNIADRNARTTQVGTVLTVAEPNPFFTAHRGHDVERYSEGPYNVAVGVLNGLLLSSLLWILGYFLFSLVSYFV